MTNRVQKVFTRPSRTKQSFKNECDVNLIMQRFKNVMGADYLSKYRGYIDGQFGDFSEVMDYRDALNHLNRVRGYFDTLPAKVRSRFFNDPAEFLDFMENPMNRQEAIDLGLIDPKGAPVQNEPVQPKPTENP